MGNYKAQSGSSKPATSIAKEIQIEFTLDETADTDTSCVSPKTSGASGKCAVGKWMTHPAFQNFGITGLWVGKFETGTYNTETGYKASTTGNITGIYDISGGAWERMASFPSGAFADSGKTSADITNYSKYFDLYSSNSVQTSWNNRILGDATGDMGPFYSYKENSGTYYHNNWYADCSTFADDYWSWFGRGSGNADGVIAGQFYFQANRGNAAAYGGSRLILAVK